MHTLARVIWTYYLARRSTHIQYYVASRYAYSTMHTIYASVLYSRVVCILASMMYNTISYAYCLWYSSTTIVCICILWILRSCIYIIIMSRIFCVVDIPTLAVTDALRQHLKSHDEFSNTPLYATLTYRCKQVHSLIVHEHTDTGNGRQ